MKFKYVADPIILGLKNDIEITIEDQKKVFESFLSDLFNTKYQNSLKGTLQRRLCALFAKLDSSSDGDIDLESADVDLLKEVLINDEIGVNARQVRYLNYLRSNLEKVINEK